MRLTVQIDRYVSIQRGAREPKPPAAVAEVACGEIIVQQLPSFALPQNLWSPQCTVMPGAPVLLYFNLVALGFLSCRACPDPKLSR